MPRKIGLSPKSVPTFSPHFKKRSSCQVTKVIRAFIALMNQNAIIGGAAHLGRASCLLQKSTVFYIQSFSKNSTIQWSDDYNFVNDAGTVKMEFMPNMLIISSMI